MPNNNARGLQVVHIQGGEGSVVFTEEVSSDHWEYDARVW